AGVFLFRYFLSKRSFLYHLITFLSSYFFIFFFFFFQAEDGIRDRNVTGVQTCALPISPSPGRRRRTLRRWSPRPTPAGHWPARRSEERRVGKECRFRLWPPY